jgi:hypothetical protein
MGIYTQAFVELKDRLGAAIKVGLASGGGLPAGTSAPIHADLGVGSVSDPEATDSTSDWSISSFIRAIFKKATTFENRLTAITRDRAFMEIGGTTGNVALSSDYVPGAVRIHSFSGVSYGVTNLGAMGTPIVESASPIYIHFIRSATNTGVPATIGAIGIVTLQSSPNASTGYRDLMPPILLRGTNPQIAGEYGTDAMDQFEAKTIGPEYFGQNGLLLIGGFTMVASTRIDQIEPPTTANFFVQCQITGA